MNTSKSIKNTTRRTASKTNNIILTPEQYETQIATRSSNANNDADINSILNPNTNVSFLNNAPSIANVPTNANDTQLQAPEASILPISSLTSVAPSQSQTPSQSQSSTNSPLKTVTNFLNSINPFSKKSEQVQQTFAPIDNLGEALSPGNNVAVPGMTAVAASSSPTEPGGVPATMLVAPSLIPMSQQQQTQPGTSTSGYIAQNTELIPTLSTQQQGLSKIANKIQTFTWKFWALVIFLLALLGINIFLYIGEGTEVVANIISPIIKKIVGLVYLVFGNFINITAEGTKDVIQTTSNVAVGSLNAVQRHTPSTAKEQEENNLNISPSASSSNNSATVHEIYNPASYNNYTANEVSSPGWCYVGKSNEFRTCVEVGYNDICTSGEVYPTRQVCMNPTLRP